MGAWFSTDHDDAVVGGALSPDKMELQDAVHVEVGTDVQMHGAQIAPYARAPQRAGARQRRRLDRSRQDMSSERFPCISEWRPFGTRLFGVYK